MRTPNALQLVCAYLFAVSSVGGQNLTYRTYYPTDVDRPNVCTRVFEGKNRKLLQHNNDTNYVPFIGTSVVRDSQLLMLRSYYSIDYPVKHFIVVAAHSMLNTHRVLAYELKHLQEYAANVVLITCEVAPSCAEGWNAVFQAFPETEWGVYTARDTAWEPGSLAKLSGHMWEASRTGAVDFGLMQWSNMPPNSGGEFNAFTMTRNAINRFGLFDESIYPANFEDRDVQLRLARMEPPLVVKTFEDVSLIHGNGRVRAYKPGLGLPDDPHDPTEVKMTKFAEARFLLNANYIFRKWGCAGDTKHVSQHLWSTCLFRTPFNRTDLAVWAWQASKVGRQRDVNLQVRRTGQPGLFDLDNPVFFFPETYGAWQGYVESSDLCRLTGRLGVVGRATSGGNICM